MRVAVCDDEASLGLYYKQLMEESVSGCQVELFCSPKEFLFETQGSYPFDLIFLDIEMPDMNGMELARRIRTTDQTVPIVFLTNYADFVFDGYEVGAYRYLMKETAPEKLGELLREVGRKQEEKKEYLLVRSGGEDVRLTLSEIYYMEASKHDTVVHGRGGELLLRLPISKLARKLPEYFAAAHRSYLVNLSYVERISRTECGLVGGDCVPVSRGAYESLNQAFLEFYRRRNPQ